MTLMRQKGAAVVLGGPTVVIDLGGLRPHFSEGRADLELAFREAGLSTLLYAPEHGTRIPLRRVS